MTPRLQKAFDGYRDGRANELYELASLLSEVGIVADTEPLGQAGGQCRGGLRTAGPSQPDAGKKYWGYEIVDLQISLESQRHLRPRSAIMEDARGFLSIAVEEYIPSSEIEVGDSYKLLRRLDVDFHLDAYQIVNGTSLSLRSAWHIDTHLHAQTRDAHPRFHFQVGGEKFDAIDNRIRGVLLPETPRTPCAPLDAILAVDFVLSHYCGIVWQTLRELEPNYVRARQAPMERYWLPYYRAIANGLDQLATDPTGGSAVALNPSIFAIG